jgi:SAM-dependent methyltransferase
MRTLEETLHSVVDAIASGRLDSAERLDSLELRLGTLDSLELRLGTVDARLNDITEIQASVQTELAGIRQYTDHWLSFTYPEEVEGISAGLADALNFSSGHRGYAAQSSLWFNPALSLRYSEGSVKLFNVNERIVETTFVLAEAVARTPRGGKILDLGCGESLVAYELASYGFEVVGVDLNEYPLHHPNLRTIASPLEAVAEDDLRGFDTIVCLSAIEHFGLGAYGDDPREGRADIETLEGLAALSEPGTSLILTTPFGEASVTELQRVYDSSGLGELLDAWNLVDQRFAHRTDDHWVVEPDPRDPSNGHSVALVIATPKK